MTEGNPNELSWQDYEEVVRDIHEALGAEDGVEIVCWGRSCRVRGYSGTEHQIDVLTKHRAAPYEYLTAIECKYWNERVGKSNIATFFAVLEDINVNKGVVVSKMGFTDPAKQYAKSKNIGLIELRRPLDDDWEGRVKDITGEIVVSFPPEIYDVTVQLDTTRTHLDDSDIDLSSQWRFSADQILIEEPNGKPKTLHELSSEALSNSPDDSEYILDFPEGSILTVPNFPEYAANGTFIKCIGFKVRHRVPMTAEINIRGEDYMYMIMKDLFEDREYTIASDGSIAERGKEDLAQ